MSSATDLAGSPQHASRMEPTFSRTSWASIYSIIAWQISVGFSCSSRPITPPFGRSRILPSRTTVPLLAHAAEQVLVFCGLNERVNQNIRLLRRQGLTVRPGDTIVSGDRRDDAMDPRMAFILEKLV